MIKLAFLGCGKVADKHAGRLARHPDDVAIAFASRDRAKADAHSGALEERGFLRGV